MSTDTPVPPDRVPTLTEVVSWPEGSGSSMPAAFAEATTVVLPAVESTAPTPTQAPAPAISAPTAAPVAVPIAAPALTEAQLTQQVLADVQRQIDLMLEYRLREILTPLLARATDNLVREARTELASTLRDVVSRAVAQELSRHRPR